MSQARRTRPRRRTVAAGLTLVAVAVAAVVLATNGSSGVERTDAAAATPTTTIDRRDLVEIQTEDGRLGYSDSRLVLGQMAGTITWLPAAGKVVRRDATLYKVDQRRVYLLYGAVPAFRALGPGLSGKDVGALERNLRVLGMDRDRAMFVDGTWDAGTTAAVQRWQASHGLAQTGTIELGRVVFQPGSRRVTKLSTRVGATAGATSGGAAGAGGAGTPGEIMTTTSTKQIVAVDLETTKSSLATTGARVSVELPSRKTVSGRIARVGKAAVQPTAADGTPSGSPTVKLTIKLTGRASAIDQAPVTVRLERSRAKDVLAIPVTALLARSGGRFAVEVVDAGGRRIVPVKTGLYTSGYVEISGAGLREGMRVANAAV